jgi:uncharacterized protein YktA (UPF0223 family)
VHNLIDTGVVVMKYSYPFSLDWTTQEIIDVIKFFECIEKAYESGIKREDMLQAYRRFKEIVPSKSEEKKMFKEFQEVSGYSSYHVVKKTRDSHDGEFIDFRPHNRG